jgi:hypothetical protein
MPYLTTSSGRDQTREKTKVLPTPENGEEAAYLSVAAIRALIDMLTSKGVLSVAEFEIMKRHIVRILLEDNNFMSQRAAQLFGS